MPSLTNVMGDWVDAEKRTLRLAGEEGRNDYGSRSDGEKRKKKEEAEGIWRSSRRCFDQEESIEADPAEKGIRRRDPKAPHMERIWINFRSCR